MTNSVQDRFSSLWGHIREITTEWRFGLSILMSAALVFAIGHASKPFDAASLTTATTGFAALIFGAALTGATLAVNIPRERTFAILLAAQSNSKSNYQTTIRDLPNDEYQLLVRDVGQENYRPATYDEVSSHKTGYANLIYVFLFTAGSALVLATLSLSSKLLPDLNAQTYVCQWLPRLAIFLVMFSAIYSLWQLWSCIRAVWLLAKLREASMRLDLFPQARRNA
jgi:hypothetical protein